MSEDNKTVLNEEELSAASGGLHTSSNPEVSTNCWFTPNGSGIIKNGRMECNTHCKGSFGESGFAMWKQCRCHGSDACVNRWHLECGHPKRYP